MSATGLEIRGNCKQSNKTYRGRKVSISVKCKEIWLAFPRVLSFCSFVPFVVNLYPGSWELFLIPICFLIRADPRPSAAKSLCLPSCSFVSFVVKSFLGAWSCSCSHSAFYSALIPVLLLRTAFLFLR